MDGVYIPWHANHVHGEHILLVYTQATTDKHRGLQQELAGLVQDLKHTCNTLVDSSTKYDLHGHHLLLLVVPSGHQLRTSFPHYHPTTAKQYRRLERIAEQESAHLRKYQRALTLMTNQATEAQL